jgi:hypothetical protein
MTKDKIIILGIIALFISCNSKSTSETHSITNNIQTTTEVDSIEILRPSFWIFGLPDRKDHQRQIIAPIYKFRYKIKGNCLVSDSLVKACDKHNKTTDSVLLSRLGANWKTKFEYSVDSLYSLDSLSVGIAKADPYILNFDTLTKKHNNKFNFYPGLQYKSYTTNQENIRVVVIDGWGVINNDVGWVNYLRATVDLKSKKVINIDKTAYGQ